jgi:ribonuclease D
MNPVSLLQVSDRQVCYLFRLNHTGISPSIRRLLEDATVPKIGLSLHDDLMQLHRRHDFVTGNFIDLQDHVREIGIEDMSLQKIYANLFHRKISKRQRLTNWEADVLTERQKLYAATDAWSCIMIYDELQRLKQTNDYELIKVEANG